MPQFKFCTAYVMAALQDAFFVTSVKSLQQLPAHIGAEVAFAGRSNAGKSSAINTLTRQRRLAYVSKTPGRTQLINFFQLDERRFLIDLPGYGYAEVPLALKKEWQQLLVNYLAARTQLNGLIVIMDIRQAFSPLDVQLLEWFYPSGKPMHILLTKADKLSRGASLNALSKAQDFLQANFPAVSVQRFSSLKKQGVTEAETVLCRWLELTLPKPIQNDAHKKPPAKGE